jgi:hypothetical protein
MPDNKKPPVLEVLNGAKSPKASGKKPTGKAGGNGGGGDSPKEVSFYQFRVINGGYYFNKVLRDGEQVNVQLTNFAKQRAKLSRILGKKALKSFHPRLFNDRLFAGDTWSDKNGCHTRNQTSALC